VIIYNIDYTDGLININELCVCCFLPGRMSVGQNLAASSHKSSWTDMIISWESEKVDYTYDDTTHEIAGHYTQVYLNVVVVAFQCNALK